MRKIFTRKPKLEITDSHQLLREIERKDTLFRTFATIFGAVVLALNTAILLIVLSNTTQTKQIAQTSSDTVKGQSKVIDELAQNSKTRTRQINDLQNHIDCIVDLFTLPNRTNLTITNIQSCQLTASASGGSTGSTKSTVNNETPQTSTEKPASNNSHNPGGQTRPPTQPGKSNLGTLKKLTCKVTLGLVCLK